MIVTRLNGIRAAIDLRATGFGPYVLVGELRDNQNRPLSRPAPVGGQPAGLDCLRVAPATADGLYHLLAGLYAIARHEILRVA